MMRPSCWPPSPPRQTRQHTPDAPHLFSCLFNIWSLLGSGLPERSTHFPTLTAGPVALCPGSDDGQLMLPIKRVELLMLIYIASYIIDIFVLKRIIVDGKLNYDEKAILLYLYRERDLRGGGLNWRFNRP